MVEYFQSTAISGEDWNDGQNLVKQNKSFVISKQHRSNVEYIFVHNAIRGQTTSISSPRNRKF